MNLYPPKRVREGEELRNENEKPDCSVRGGRCLIVSQYFIREGKVVTTVYLWAYDEGSWKIGVVHNDIQRMELKGSYNRDEQ